MGTDKTKIWRDSGNKLKIVLLKDMKFNLETDKFNTSKTALDRNDKYKISKGYWRKLEVILLEDWENSNQNVLKLIKNTKEKETPTICWNKKMMSSREKSKVMKCQ